MSQSSLIVLLLRYGLAVVFAVAAVAKLRDLSATHEAARNLGVPKQLSGPVAVLLPMVEAGVAAALLFPSTATVAAAVAMALVLVFSVVVAVQLARGKRPNCNCFGSASAAPIGATTLVRNGGIGLAALAILARRDPTDACTLGCASELSAAQTTGLVLGTLVVAAIGVHSWILVNLLRQRGELLARVERLEEAMRASGGNTVGHAAAHRRHARHAGRGLALGSPAPRFALDDVAGNQVTIDDLLAGEDPVVFVFLEPRCEACVAIAGEIADLAGDTTRPIVAIVHGSHAETVERIPQRGFAAVLVDVHGEVNQRYSVAGTPAAVLVTPRARIASPLAEGRGAVSAVLSEAFATRAPEEPVTPAAAEVDG